MFKFNEEKLDVLMKITVSRPISNKDVISNVIGNLFTPAGGDIPYKSDIILCKDNLYLVDKAHASIGFAEEIRGLTIIPLEEIITATAETVEGKTHINIATAKAHFSYIKEKDSDGLGLAMISLINDIKKTV